MDKLVHSEQEISKHGIWVNVSMGSSCHFYIPWFSTCSLLLQFNKLRCNFSTPKEITFGSSHFFNIHLRSRWSQRLHVMLGDIPRAFLGTDQDELMRPATGPPVTALSGHLLCHGLKLPSATLLFNGSHSTQLP